MGVQLGRSSGPVREAAAAVRELPTAAGGRHRASLMIKRTEAAAAVRPGPAAPIRLPAHVVSAAHMPGPVRRAGDAASIRLRIAGPAGPFVLAWTGDRSPVRGCTTTTGDQVPPRTPNQVKSPRNGHRLNTRRWFSPVWGKLTVCSGQVPPRTLETVGNPPHAHRLNTPAGARTPAAGPVLLIAGRQP